MTTAIIDLGCANLASVRFALDRLGARYCAVKDAAGLGDAERIIFPGVGSARYASDELDRTGLRDCLAAAPQPIFGICLGMQLLFESSDEGDAQGLGLLPGRVRRLRPPAGAPWPHMGWSRLSRRRPESRLLQGVENGAYTYFVHGYASPPGENVSATAEYGEPFAAIVEQGRLYGCQFHPERSGAVGAQILKNFLDAPC